MEFNRSNFANILITTRLLPYFNDDNIAAMKSCIFDELKCANETEFLCKILTMISGLLSNKSTAIIKNKALQIADSQPLSSHVQPPTTKDKYTVYKHLQNTYKNSLLSLNSAIIDLIGSYLAKKDSILLGHVNKQLYIETQKISYLLQRCKDTTSKKPFVLDSHRVSRLSWSTSSPYNYNFPAHLTIKNLGPVVTNSWKNIFNKDFFNNFFLRLNCLKCRMLAFIPYIPVNVLFNSKCNFYDSDESREYIKEFSIVGLQKNASKRNVVQGCDLFCQKFEKYKKLNGSKMRKIKYFRFNAEYNYCSNTFMNGVKDWTMPHGLTKVVLFLCGISEEITIEGGIDALGIKSVNQLKQVFHPKLKRFCFEKGNLAFDINDDNGNDANDDSDKEKEKEEKEDECKLKRQMGEMLEEIEITHFVFDPGANTDNNENTQEIYRTLSFLDQFEIRRNIKQYTINWCVYGYDTVSEFLLDKLFLHDCDKYPLLENVVFKIDGMWSSGIDVCISSIVQYLFERKQEFFIDKELQFRLNHLKSIDIELEIGVDRRFDFGIPQINIDMNSNQVFAVDQQVITIQNVGRCIDSLDKDIIRWLQGAIAMHMITVDKEEMIHRRVVLTV